MEDCKYVYFWQDNEIGRVQGTELGIFDQEAAGWKRTEFGLGESDHPYKPVNKGQAEKLMRNGVPCYAPVAREIARKAHQGQTDKAGKDYFSGHLTTVATSCSYDAAQAAGWLHDVLEDTEMTAEDLLAAGMSEEIVAAVETMTHRDGEPYMDYVARVKKNNLARYVKSKDLHNNMNLSRLEEVTEKDLARLEKYKKALAFLYEDWK